MTGWVKTCHYADFKPDMRERMREREYGIVEDEADSVELTASINEETDQRSCEKKTQGKTQWEETMESII